jgi:hypothetical protein
MQEKGSIVKKLGDLHMAIPAKVVFSCALIDSTIKYVKRYRKNTVIFQY